MYPGGVSMLALMSAEWRGQTITVFQRSRPGSQLTNARPRLFSMMTSSQFRRRSWYLTSWLLNVCRFWKLPGRFANIGEKAV